MKLHPQGTRRQPLAAGRCRGARPDGRLHPRSDSLPEAACRVVCVWVPTRQLAFTPPRAAATCGGPACTCTRQDRPAP